MYPKGRMSVWRARYVYIDMRNKKKMPSINLFDIVVIIAVGAVVAAVTTALSACWFFGHIVSIKVFTHFAYQKHCIDNGVSRTKTKQIDT